MTMGTSGTGAFENDGAMDWAFKLTSLRAGTNAIAGALKRANKTRPGTAVDLDNALEGLAAAQIVAAGRGHPAKTLPENILEWVNEKNFVPDRAMTQQSLDAVRRIAENSELKESWNGEHAAAWQKEQRALLKRLALPF